MPRCAEKLIDPKSRSTSPDYKLQFVNDAQKGEFFDLAMVMKEDFRFSSNPEFGLEAVDIVTNTVRRSLSGNFARAGWMAIPQLMIHRGSHCIRLISLSPESASSHRIPYARVIDDFRDGGRSLLPRGYFTSDNGSTMGHRWSGRVEEMANEGAPDPLPAPGSGKGGGAP